MVVGLGLRGNQWPGRHLLPETLALPTATSRMQFEFEPDPWHTLSVQSTSEIEPPSVGNNSICGYVPPKHELPVMEILEIAMALACTKIQRPTVPGSRAAELPLTVTLDVASMRMGEAGFPAGKLAVLPETVTGPLDETMSIAS